MKLFYAPGVCSLSPHIALLEAGLAFDLQKVDLKSHRLADGGDFYAVNAKGSVPVLQLDDGQLLTEGPAIVQYIADQKPESNLAPKAGSMERYRLQEWLNFITSEIHKGFSPLFGADTPDAYKDLAKAKLGKRFDWLSTQLGGKAYLLGETFTVADGYLFTLLNWCQWVSIDLAGWPVLKDYHTRVAERPKVRQAMKVEGLVK